MSKSKKTSSSGTLILFIIILIFGIWAFSKCSGYSTDTSSSDTSDKSSAFVISTNFVESFLKSPSSADFPFLDYSSVILENNKYQITSYVDSQNSYGAMIRNNWTTIVKYEGDSTGYGNADIQNWELEELIFDGEVIYP